MQLMLMKLIIKSVLHNVMILMFKSIKDPINGKNQLKQALTIAMATKRVVC